MTKSEAKTLSTIFALHAESELKLAAYTTEGDWKRVRELREMNQLAFSGVTMRRGREWQIVLSIGNTHVFTIDTLQAVSWALSKLDAMAAEKVAS